MNINMKQLRFFFPIWVFFGMITGVIHLSSEKCLALEQHPPFSYYEAIEQRNIFRPKIEKDDLTQDKKFEEPALPDYTVSTLDKYVLTGIVKIRGQYKATITDKNTKNGHYVSIEDVFDDFTVMDIQQDKVILEQNDKTYEFKINTPASRVSIKKTEETAEASSQAPLPEEPVSQKKTAKPRTNMMKSIRMGTSNVPRN